jgi:hypothetical protein
MEERGLGLGLEETALRCLWQLFVASGSSSNTLPLDLKEAVGVPDLYPSGPTEIPLETKEYAYHQPASPSRSDPETKNLQGTRFGDLPSTKGGLFKGLCSDPQKTQFRPSEGFPSAVDQPPDGDSLHSRGRS